MCRLSRLVAEAFVCLRALRPCHVLVDLIHVVRGETAARSAEPNVQSRRSRRRWIQAFKKMTERPSRQEAPICYPDIRVELYPIHIELTHTHTPHTRHMQLLCGFSRPSKFNRYPLRLKPRCVNVNSSGANRIYGGGTGEPDARHPTTQVRRGHIPMYTSHRNALIGSPMEDLRVFLP